MCQRVGVSTVWWVGCVSARAVRGKHTTTQNNEKVDKPNHIREWVAYKERMCVREREREREGVNKLTFVTVHSVLFLDYTHTHTHTQTHTHTTARPPTRTAARSGTSSEWVREWQSRE